MRTFILTVAVLCSSGAGAMQSLVGDSQKLTGQSGGPTPTIDGIYQFKHKSELVPSSVVINGQEQSNYEAEQSMKFGKGEPVAVQFLPTGEVLLTPILSEEEEGDTPEQIVISQEEFYRAGLAFVEEGDAIALNDKYTVYNDTMEASRNGGARRLRKSGYARVGSRQGNRGHRSSGYGSSRGRSHGWGNGGCVNYVKRTLGIFGHFGNGVGTASALLRTGRGFHKVSCASPTVGTVASWGGGSQGYGHTAIWNGSCWKTSVPGCPPNRGNPGRGYHFVGCVNR